MDLENIVITKCLVSFRINEIVFNDINSMIIFEPAIVFLISDVFGNRFVS